MDTNRVFSLVLLACSVSAAQGQQLQRDRRSAEFDPELGRTTKLLHTERGNWRGTDRGIVILESEDGEMEVTALGDCEVGRLETREDGSMSASCGGEIFVLRGDQGWIESKDQAVSSRATAAAVGCHVTSWNDTTYFPLSTGASQSTLRIWVSPTTCRPTVRTTKSFLSLRSMTARGNGAYDVLFAVTANSDGRWRLADLQFTNASFSYRVPQRGFQPAGSCEVAAPWVNAPSGGGSQSVLVQGTVNTEYRAVVTNGNWLRVATPQGNVEMANWPLTVTADPGHNGSGTITLYGQRIEGTGLADCYGVINVVQY